MIYYGETPKGKKIHVGNFVVKEARRGDWVYTVCGNEMQSWVEGERPEGSKVEDFCHNCFRAYAWEIMQKALTDSFGGLITVPVEEVYSNDIKPKKKPVRR